MSMSQMSSMREVHAQDLVAVVERCHKHGHVRLRPAVRLYIRMLSPEKLFGAFNGRILYDICEFAATVVALAGITLGVLIRECSSHRLQDCFRDKILGRDKLQAIGLTANL